MYIDTVTPTARPWVFNHGDVKTHNVVEYNGGGLIVSLHSQRPITWPWVSIYFLFILYCHAKIDA